MTVQGIYDLMTKTFGISEANTRFDLHFYKAINDAQNEIAQKKRWGFLLTDGTMTTTASTRTVSLPSDFNKFAISEGAFRLVDEDGASVGTLDFVTAERYYRSGFDDGEEGQPTEFYIIGNTVYFSPIPDDEYTLSFFYYKQPVKIESSEGTIIVPDRYSDLFETLVAKKLNRLGYSAIVELQMDEQFVKSLYYNMAKDDTERYGKPSFGLPPRTYTRKLVD